MEITLFHDRMKSITNEKLELLLKFMETEKLDLIMITDSEQSRDLNFQYICGHPTDGILFITAGGETTLIPWDTALAKTEADVDRILDHTQYEYSTIKTSRDYFENILKKPNASIGVSRGMLYGEIIRFETMFPELKFTKEPSKISRLFEELRATKSNHEMDLLMEATKIAEDTLQDIIHFAKNATTESEQDLSFLVQTKMAKRGAEDLAFPSLVANTNRSHTLHCHPYATESQFALPGLALIDFGAKYKGYNSDITQSFTFGDINQEQQRMRDITQKAYDAAVETMEIGIPLWKINKASMDVLTEAGFSMPYALGHGLGLSEHDAPFISKKPTDDFQKKYWKEVLLEEGHVFTIEPGTYKEDFGGLRIENDFMVRNGKIIQLTHTGIYPIE
ncbi:Xaa-Pro dipeptidase [Candidatus Lokiarchaeum ossiferum]|uniref:Xaa-Pro dipeptidase n=1 Tax=Candidatus Lokiarchaeum ossiferum TaxID=2951803 RepID=A0ABY6HYH3_9ARCH|nr:Xaa-Pro dipeptidase [Candidatus Lokiarchaeum sp. B-35]